MRHQGEYDSQDLLTFTATYVGPIEGIQLVFNHEFLDVIDNLEPEIWPCMLARAIANFGGGSLGWEWPVRLILRRIIRCDPSRDGNFSDRHLIWVKDEAYSYENKPLLHSLYERVESPIDSMTVGDAWLHILETEGYNFTTYLVSVNAQHNGIEEIGYFYLHLVRCICELQPRPRLYWNWYVDPAFPNYHLQGTFQELAMPAGVFCEIYLSNDLWEWSDK